MTGEQLVGRLQQLKQGRAFIEAAWREAYNATYPMRGASIGQDTLDSANVAASQDQMQRIYDSTLRDSCNILAAGLQTGLTPANSQWFDTTIKTDDHAGKRWMADLAKAVWENIHNSNYDVAAYEIFLDYIVAMACMDIEEGDLADGLMYNFRPVPIGSCYFADSNGNGTIDTRFRLYAMTAEQAVTEFKDKRYPLSVKIKEANKKRPDDKFWFLHAIFPNTDHSRNRAIKLPVASLHVEVATKQIVRMAGYHETPFVVLRWMPVPGSVYGLGPSENGLPDHRTVNELVRLVLANADMAIAGMWGAVDDGVLNPKTITVGARKIIAVASKESFFPLQSGAKFDVSALLKADLQGQIRRSMKADQLHPDKGPEMTAYEIQQRMNLIAKQLGPLYSRLQPEYLSPLIRRCTGILLRAAAATGWAQYISKPPASAEKQLVKINYQSPLARMQKAEELQAMDAYEDRLIFASEKGFTSPIDLYDMDSAYRERSELIGVHQKHMRSKADVEKMRKVKMAAVEEERQRMEEQALKEKTAPAVVKSLTGKGNE